MLPCEHGDGRGERDHAAIVVRDAALHHRHRAAALPVQRLLDRAAELAGGHLAPPRDAHHAPRRDGAPPSVHVGTRHQSQIHGVGEREDLAALGAPLFQPARRPVAEFDADDAGG
ncbi:MAG: hypothetical protein F4237_14555 [Gemmatimonadetes bacterium]|nr:hypothetical protein [Gemmatimonadota bacterium]